MTSGTWDPGRGDDSVVDISSLRVGVLEERGDGAGGINTSSSRGTGGSYT